MAQRRQALVEAVTNHDTEGFLQLMKDNKSRSSAFQLEEVLVELPRAQLDALWDSLLGWSTLCLDTLVPPEEDDVEPVKAELVCGILDVALATVSGLQPAADGAVPVPGGLLQTAVIYNAMLLSLDELPALDAVCGRVARLSELWWSRELPERQTLAPAALTYLLQLAVATDHKTTRSLVQRIAALLPCLSAHVFLSSGGGRLRQLLCAAAQVPALLAWDEGVRLLGELIGQPPLRAPLHAAIKAKLPAVTTQQAYKYGQAYYRAWKAAEPADREAVEEECLQDLMYHAVHADRSRGRLARLLYQLLHFTHNQRNHRETAQMLVRLYQPILWRALSAPNETVQLNATFLLLDVFPLEDPAESREARDEELGRQCRLLANLLQESCHRVRAAAARGVCKALAQFWDTMPPESVKQMMKVMLQDLAFDAAAVDVRLQVVSGMSAVLENPFSHPFMKSALPFLANAFHDVHLSVRVAMCDLLLKVKNIKNIRYFDVVPVKHLLARLAVDEPPVCRRIVQLMVNSFFPASESDETLLNRCIFLIQENREASRRFYQHSGEVLTLEDAVRLMIAIRQALTIHAKRQQQQRAAAGGGGARRASSAGDKENNGARARPGKRRLHNVNDRSVLSDASQESTSSDESALESRAPPPPPPPASPLDKEEVVTGLVDVVAVLWTCRLAELAQEVALLERLQQAWTRVLPLVFNEHKDSAAGGSLLYLSSLLPHAPMAPLASHCLSALRQLPEEASPQRCAELLDPLLNWGRCDDVIELCAECLQAAFDGERSFVASQKVDQTVRRSAAGVRFRDPRRPRPRPRLALRWLLHLFTPSLRRHVLTAKYGPALAELHAWMAACAKPLAEERLASERRDPDRDELALDLLRALLVVSLALGSSERPAAARATVTELLQWGHRLMSERSRWLNAPLLGRVAAALTEGAVNAPLTGALEPPLAAAAADWMAIHLSAPDTDAARCVTALFLAADLLEAVTARPPAELPPWAALCREHAPRLVGAAVGQLTNLWSAGGEASPAQLSELSTLLRSVVASWRRLPEEGAERQRDLAALVLAAAVQRTASDKLKGSTAAPSPDLCPLTTALLAPLWRDEPGRRLLLDRLEAALAITEEEEEDDEPVQLVGHVVTAAYVLRALVTAKPAALGLCRPACSAALAAAGRIKADQLTGDDAPVQHLSAARRLLEELNAQCAA